MKLITNSHHANYAKSSRQSPNHKNGVLYDSTNCSSVNISERSHNNGSEVWTKKSHFTICNSGKPKMQ